MMDDITRRLLLRCRTALTGCPRENELDMDMPERAATLNRRIADIDAAPGRFQCTSCGHAGVV